MPDVDVCIIGAGLAGLACARHLHRHNVPFRLVDQANAVGGRVRTDVVDGFQLDRGFQVLLTAYPETQRELDYEALDLHAYFDGALVRVDGAFHRISDPFSHPLYAPATLMSPIGTFSDKLRVARVRSRLTRLSVSEVMMRDETTTLDALQNRWGFSSMMINRFYRPFFGGIFFDRQLQASSRMFEFTFKMFAEGRTTLPATGIEAIPRQMAADLPAEALQLNTRAEAIDGQHVRFADGKELEAASIVVATDGPAAQQLVGEGGSSKGRATTCLYYAAPSSPHEEPILVLNGEGPGPINNLSVLSDVAPSYAPDDRALISVVVLGNPDAADEALEQSVRTQLQDWYGPVVENWRHLRTYRIPHALPDQQPPFLSPPERPVRYRDGLYVCGDHRNTASLNGAIASGRAAAKAVLQDRPAVVK